MARPRQHLYCIWRTCLCGASAVLALAAMLVLTIVAGPSAQAQSKHPWKYQYRVLYAFKGGQYGPDGANPYASVVRDAAGNLYGNTLFGGESGLGTVFKLAPTGKETVLHSFAGSPDDGENPQLAMILDKAGNIFGTTFKGGYYGGCGFYGSCGMVFKLDRTGAETVLHNFSEGADGGLPAGDLVWGAGGNFYGTTEYGGLVAYGTVFKFDRAGSETVLYNFTGGFDGAVPGDIIRDAQGNIYGTAFYGGVFGEGTVFKLSPSGEFSVLRSFEGQKTLDGSLPVGKLFRDRAGSIYGTTLAGGSGSCNGGLGGGCGTVFKVDRTGRETVVHNFHGLDGEFPYGGITGDAAGNLYGTTAYGGSHNEGVVFKIDQWGKETVLHNFAGGSDGAGPNAGLLLGEADNLYGTTTGGGPYGEGTVFELSSN
jgi:uncharacterized repeat protein (TIGR03803 family)